MKKGSNIEYSVQVLPVLLAIITVPLSLVWRLPMADVVLQ